MNAATAQIGGLDLAAARAMLAPWPDVAPAIGHDEYLARIDHAQRLLRSAEVDALVVTAGASLRYFTGVPWGASERLVALLLPARGDPCMVCPAFETGSLAAVLRLDASVHVWEEHENPHALLAGLLRERHAACIALDPTAPHGVAARLGAVLGSTPGDATVLINACRMAKSPAEIALMQQATAMTLAVHKLVARVVHAGIGNRELTHFIDEAHRALGADNGSTFCIVQFGRATAYPHGLPGEQRLQEGELVLVDTGCTVQGYHSDITRCYPLGEVGGDVRRIWDLEHAAQAAAFNAVRPGVACEAADAAAREVIVRAGLGPDYRLPGIPHRTGHGCGMAIHEAPYIVRGDTTPLVVGMCASDEPMIVVPARFGVRLEDHFHVTAEGAAWFTEPSPAIDQPFA